MHVFVSVHLVAVSAADEIPSNVESLLHNLFSYFSRSAKRQSILFEFQQYMKKSKLEIPEQNTLVSIVKMCSSNARTMGYAPRII